eukprot:1705916-Rhodomonas_salina.1
MPSPVPCDWRSGTNVVSGATGLRARYAMSGTDLAYGALYSVGMFYANVAFTFIFICEATVKLVGLGPRWYFLDVSWAPQVMCAVDLLLLR